MILLSSVLIDQRQSMLRNHRLLIRMAYQHAHRITRTANFRAIGGIHFRVQFDA